MTYHAEIFILAINSEHLLARKLPKIRKIYKFIVFTKIKAVQLLRQNIQKWAAQIN